MVALERAVKAGATVLEAWAHGAGQQSFGPVEMLALLTAHPQDEWWDFDMPTEHYPARSLRRAYRWFRSNW